MPVSVCVFKLVSTWKKAFQLFCTAEAFHIPAVLCYLLKVSKESKGAQWCQIYFYGGHSSVSLDTVKNTHRAPSVSCEKSFIYIRAPHRGLRPTFRSRTSQALPRSAGVSCVHLPLSWIFSFFSLSIASPGSPLSLSWPPSELLWSLQSPRLVINNTVRSVFPARGPVRRCQADTN